MRLARALLAVTLYVSPLFPQFRGAIGGTIKDTSGAVIPGAKVTLTNNETQRQHIHRLERRGFLSLRRSAARLLQYRSLGQGHEHRRA